MEINSAQKKEAAKVTPKDFFLIFGAMAALYVSVVSLINLIFQTINFAFPDPLTYSGDPYSSGIRLAIASLLIIFPLFIFLSRLIFKEFSVHPFKRDLAIRKWLIHLTLFLAGTVLVVDLVTLVNTFLAGELTIRFILKVLTIILVVGGVFGYFLYDLKRQDQRSFGKDKLFATLASAAVLLAIIGGFAIMGSPAEARLRLLDERRISDLQNIQWQIVSYWQQKGKLPQSLVDLSDPIAGFNLPTDPLSGDAYEYLLVGDLSFQLCANFSRQTIGEGSKLKERGRYGVKSLPAYDSFNSLSVAENWEHAVGRYCFERVIDPDRYPPAPNKR
jgi:hypothetical protein